MLLQQVNQGIACDQKGNAKALTVESNIKYIFCLDEIYIVIEELDALLVIHDAAAYFLFASEALAS